MFVYEQVDMFVWYYVLCDVCSRGVYQLCCVEYLFGCGDVIVFFGQQVEWVGDIVQVQYFVQCYVLVVCQQIVFEDLVDGLEILVFWQVDWCFVLGCEDFVFGQIYWVVDVLEQVYMFVEVMFVGMYVFLVLQYEIVVYEVVVGMYQVFVEVNWCVFYYLFEWVCFCFGIDG